MPGLIRKPGSKVVHRGHLPRDPHTSLGIEKYSRPSAANKSTYRSRYIAS